MLNTFGPAAFFVLFILWILWMTARVAIHTQKRLADNGEQDWLVDALAWIGKRTSRGWP